MPQDNIQAILPIPPSVTDPQLRQWLQAMRDAANVRFGQTRNQLDRSPTVRELIDQGLVEVINYTANLQPAKLTPVLPQTPFTSVSVPPAPVNLQVSSTPFRNILTWNSPSAQAATIIAYTEVYAFTSDVQGSATLIGIGNASFIHAVEPSSTTYYWVRYRTFGDVAGPFNAVGGVVGTTPQDPAGLLTLINQSLTSSELTHLLNTQVKQGSDIMFSEDFGDGSLSRIQAVWTAIETNGEELVSAAANPLGAYIYRLGDNSGNDDVARHLDQTLAMPVISGEIYKVTFVWRQVLGFGASASAYFGVMGWAGDVRNSLGTMVNTAGADSASTQHWFAENSTEAADANWITSTGYFQLGAGSGDDLSGVTTIDALGDLHSSVEYITPYFRANNDDQTGRVDIALVQLERMHNGAEIINTRSKYAIKVDVNGHVAGFGLISTNNDGTTVAEMQVAVDKFSIRSPGSTSVVFAVDSGSVVMDGVFIKDATITNAKVSTLDAAKITTGLLSATRINLDGLTLINNGGQLEVGGVSLGTHVKNEAGAILADIDVRNDQAVTSALSAMNSNPSMQAQRRNSNGDLAPASWFRSNNAGFHITYEDDTVRDILRLNNGHASNAAFPVNAGTEYEFAIRISQVSGSSSIVDMVASEYDTADLAGKIAIGHTSNAESEVQAETRTIAVANNMSLTTTYVVISGTYTPTATAKWASLKLMTGGTDILVDWGVVRTKSTYNTGNLADLDTVDTAEIAADAVSDQGSNRNTSATVTDATWVTKATVTITAAASTPVQVLGSMIADLTDDFFDNGGTIETRLQEDGADIGATTLTVIPAGGGALKYTPVGTWVEVRTPGAGSVTYRLQIKGTYTSTSPGPLSSIQQSSLSVMSLKR